MGPCISATLGSMSLKLCAPPAVFFAVLLALAGAPEAAQTVLLGGVIGVPGVMSILGLIIPGP